MGAYENATLAGALATRLRAAVDQPVGVAAAEVGGRRLHRVRIGPVAGEDWGALVARLTAAGYAVIGWQPNQAAPSPTPTPPAPAAAPSPTPTPPASDAAPSPTPPAPDAAPAPDADTAAEAAPVAAAEAAPPRQRSTSPAPAPSAAPPEGAAEAATPQPTPAQARPTGQTGAPPANESAAAARREEYTETFVAPSGEGGQSLPPPRPALTPAGAARAFVTTDDEGVFIRIGDYRVRQDAEQLRSRFGAHSQVPAQVVDEQATPPRYRVRIGPVETDSEFEALLAVVDALGFAIH